jgi:CheY-like chemotaxis protein
MKNVKKSLVILMAEDDDDDVFLARKALKDAKVLNVLKRVCNGQELLDYLHRKDKFADENEYPWPSIILLDLNMPIMDGKQALSLIKNNEKFKAIPVVILTTSSSEIDVLESYQLGANSYIVKPVDFIDMINMVKQMSSYWIDIVEIPNGAK